MDTCPAEAIVIRVHRRTIDMIRALDNRVTLEGNEEKFFMIFCADSDHEEYATIDKETYDRTYGPMPGHIHVMEVKTID